MVGTPRALGIVALLVGSGVSLSLACGGPARSTEPPMAGSAAILPSPVSAEIVPKSAPKDAMGQAPTHAAASAPSAEIALPPPPPPPPSASASTSPNKPDKANAKKAKPSQ